MKVKELSNNGKIMNRDEEEYENLMDKYENSDEFKDWTWDDEDEEMMIQGEKSRRIAHKIFPENVGKWFHQSEKIISDEINRFYPLEKIIMDEINRFYPLEKIIRDEINWFYPLEKIIRDEINWFHALEKIIRDEINWFYVVEKIIMDEIKLFHVLEKIIMDEINLFSLSSRGLVVRAL
jgi:hypothetical protein